MSPYDQVPVGVSLSADVEYRPGRPTPYRARVRWIDPTTGCRRSVSEAVQTTEEAEAWIELMRDLSRAGVDPSLAVKTLTEYGEAVMSLAIRGLALADWNALEHLAAALVARSAGHYPGWGEVVEFTACTAARIGETSGVRRADIDTKTWLWNVRRQTTPGPGGMIDKGTKGKRARMVPIIVEIRPLVERRLHSIGDDPMARLFTGPRGGRISTAVLRDATHWDEVVTKLGYDYLRRHDLRHTGLTWMERRGVASDATFHRNREGALPGLQQPEPGEDARQDRRQGAADLRCQEPVASGSTMRHRVRLRRTPE
jgi:integrase-like protein